MNIIIFAGGNQTRFGIPFHVQPKVLTPLPNNQTLLGHTITQLQKTDSKRITVAIADKKTLAQYLHAFWPKARVPVTTDDFPPMPLGHYIFRYLDQSPVTFLFGDIYFPDNSLIRYFTELAYPPDLVAAIGVSRERVGDYCVNVQDSLVHGIGKEVTGQFFTCGIFTVFNQKVVASLSPTDKVTELFTILVERGHPVGYVKMPNGLIDLDTVDKLKLLPKTE